MNAFCWHEHDSGLHDHIIDQFYIILKKNCLFVSVIEVSKRYCRSITSLVNQYLEVIFIWSANEENITGTEIYRIIMWLYISLLCILTEFFCQMAYQITMDIVHVHIHFTKNLHYVLNTSIFFFPYHMLSHKIYNLIEHKVSKKELLYSVFSHAHGILHCSILQLYI